jgi:hypothetical protein
MIPANGISLKLRRFQVRENGAFGYLSSQAGEQVAVTCERTFDDPVAPVIPAGTYQCVRGMHTLDGTHYFVTYEVTGVPGHTGLLFHTGNTELDSKGCILLGTYFGTLGGELAVLESRQAFANFLSFVGNFDSFELEVA